MRYVSAIPAYGRDYKTAKETREAWANGADFLIQDLTLHGYISKAEKPADMVLNVRIRNQTTVVVIR